MILALLDAHRLSDLGSDANPYRIDEVMISRSWNRDLSWALNALSCYGVVRCDIDHHRPQDDRTSFDLKRRAVEQCAATFALETHCNFHPDEAVHGWVVEYHDGDTESERVGRAIRDAWAGVVPREHVRLRPMPCEGYTYSWLFDNLEVPFCLPELPNLGVIKYRRMLLNRGQLYRRLIEATAVAVKGVLT